MFKLRHDTTTGAIVREMLLQRTIKAVQIDIYDVLEVVPFHVVAIKGKPAAALLAIFFLLVVATTSREPVELFLSIVAYIHLSFDFTTPLRI